MKGAEYDSVIAYALLEGMVPHFADDNKPEAAKRLLYVVCSPLPPAEVRADGQCDSAGCLPARTDM